jgi:hypothetical protein
VCYIFGAASRICACIRLTSNTGVFFCIVIFGDTVTLCHASRECVSEETLMVVSCGSSDEIVVVTKGRTCRVVSSTQRWITVRWVYSLPAGI